MLKICKTGSKLTLQNQSTRFVNYEVIGTTVSGNEKIILDKAAAAKLAPNVQQEAEIKKDPRSKDLTHFKVIARFDVGPIPREITCSLGALGTSYSIVFKDKLASLECLVTPTP